MEELKNIKLPKALADELRKAEQVSAISWQSTNEGVHERVNFDDTIWGLSLAGGAFYRTPLRVTQIKLPKALADELRKAEQVSAISWQSTNEGVHERVNFDDTIWGLSLAGGAFYRTPLRVTQVKEGSRAEHAGIKVGDYLTSINDIDSTTLTIQEAHDMILESGLQIKFAFAAPDVEETVHTVYQDVFEDEEEVKKRSRGAKISKKQVIFKGAKTNNVWSCAWPCNKKRDIMYRESNCFLVPSRYASKHPDSILIGSKGNGKESKAETATMPEV